MGQCVGRCAPRRRRCGSGSLHLPEAAHLASVHRQNHPPRRRGALLLRCSDRHAAVRLCCLAGAAPARCAAAMAPCLHSALEGCRDRRSEAEWRLKTTLPLPGPGAAGHCRELHGVPVQKKQRRCRQDQERWHATAVAAFQSAASSVTRPFRAPLLGRLPEAREACHWQGNEKQALFVVTARQRDQRRAVAAVAAVATYGVECLQRYMCPELYASSPVHHPALLLHHATTCFAWPHQKNSAARTADAAAAAGWQAGVHLGSPCSPWLSTLASCQGRVEGSAARSLYLVPAATLTLLLACGRAFSKRPRLPNFKALQIRAHPALQGLTVATAGAPLTA